MTLTGLYFGSRGRIGRLTWWFGNLGVAMAVPGILLVVLRVAGDVLTVPMFGALMIGLAALAAATAANLHAKRFQDRGKAAMPRIAPVVGLFLLDGVVSLFGAPVGNGVIVPALDLALVAYGLWFCVELGCLPGTPGPNAFGEDPSGLPDADTAGDHTGLALPAWNRRTA